MPHIRLLLTGIYFLLFPLIGICAVPVNDDIKTAEIIPNIVGYCSGDNAFNNIEATKSGFLKGSFWNAEGKDIWFKFTAVGTDITTTITGSVNGNTNTLVSPLVAFYTYKNGTLTEQIGSMVSSNNITTGYKGGLSIGEEYYIRISAENDATGSFKLCVNSYNPPKKPGQDCSTASILCSKETFTERSVSGAGINNHESAGSCLNIESNSAWYTWTAANNGTLAFSITPTSATDDIDWVLYDLGPSGSCSDIISANVIRCASGSGVSCVPKYYITGTNFSSIDLKEQSGCVTGQDGFVKYIDMQIDHVYALLIDNFSNGNNGFTLKFDGTGEFTGPKASISTQINNQCQTNQSFTFSDIGTNYAAVNWNFGEGASTSSSNLKGPHTVTYNTSGNKTVVLEAISARGCSVISTYSFYVALKPATPIININKSSFCINDVMTLSVTEIPDAKYIWTGPNNFKDSIPSLVIPITNFNQEGDYSIQLKVGDCFSDISTVHVPPIVKRPIAGFITDPILIGKFSVPVPIQFINQSIDADIYKWEFGDGQFSSEISPTHTYTKAGTYTVSLNALTKNGCIDAISINNLVLLDNSALLIPNSFSPNGDGINDEFNINITNLKKFNINIFNRNGEKIFTTDDIFNTWKGEWKNLPVPVGAYFYSITGTDIFNNSIKYSGSITLIR